MFGIIAVIELLVFRHVAVVLKTGGRIGERDVGSVTYDVRTCSPILLLLFEQKCL